MTQKLLIDADPGIGDALAILVALADPALDVLALTACGGTVTGQQATRNLHYLTDLMDPLRHPRIGQAPHSEKYSVDLPAGLPPLSALHGRCGLGEVEPLVPDLHNRRESARLIVDVVREHPGEVRILTCGPLTNVAMAFEMDPELPVLLNGLICLGGSLHGIGDVTAMAEFNFWSDPQSAGTVMRSPVGKLLVPLEVGHSVGLTFADIERLSGLIPSTPVGELATGLLQYSARACRQLLPFEEVTLPAAAVLAIAAREARFDTAQVVADVETTGELTRGTLVLDRRRFQHRQPNVEIVATVERDAAVDYFCRGLRRAATRRG